MMKQMHDYFFFAIGIILSIIRISEPFVWENLTITFKETRASIKNMCREKEVEPEILGTEANDMTA